MKQSLALRLRPGCLLQLLEQDSFVRSMLVDEQKTSSE
jgi:hypothetical protein